MTKTQLVEEDGFQVYEVAFQSSKCRGSYDIHPESGLILERESQIGAQSSFRWTSTPAEGAAGATAGSTQQDGAILSVEKARELALKEVPGAAVTDIDLELERAFMSIRLSFIKVDMNMILCSMQRMAPAYRSKAKR